jgi:hypothetical protein
VFFEGLIDIKFEAERDEEARKDYVSKSDHALYYFLLGIEEGEDQLDREIKIFCHCHHDVGSVDPENIIEEKGPEQKEASSGRTEVETLKGNYRKEDSEYIIEGPVFSYEVEPNRDNNDSNAEDSCDRKLKFFGFKEILKERRDFAGKDDFFHFIGKGEELDSHTGDGHDDCY